MLTIIVFSKDRPMQLHAYIESLLKSDIEIDEKNINVLYAESKNNTYIKLINRFHMVNWIKEKDFDNQLRYLVETAHEYIMFGCDDVVFVREFNAKAAEELLKKQKDVFGVSLRLGSNILPKPDKIDRVADYCVWNWKECTCRHYNYPWELDSTIYRKVDIINILKKIEISIKTPNYFESIPFKNNLIEKEFMACETSEAKAIVITVNRVQDDFDNPVDGSYITQPDYLIYLYNEKNNTLDIEKIKIKKNDSIHVGREYLYFRKMDKYLKAKDLIIRFWKKIYGKKKVSTNK